MALKEKKFYPKWPGKVQGGIFYHDEPGRYKDHLIAFEGKRTSLTLKHLVKDRSRQEEKFYRAVVVCMVAQEMSITEDEAHDFLKRLLLRREESYHGKSGTVVRYHRVISVTELSDKAYRQYWKDCIDWAALPTLASGLSRESGLGLFIPYPKEVDYENY